MKATDNPDVIEAMRAATHVAKRASDLLSATSFQTTELDQMRILCVCTLVDGLWATISLIDSLGQGHVSAIQRTMVESHGDLHHLLGPDALVYLDRLKLTSAKKHAAEATELIKNRQGSDPATVQVREFAQKQLDDAKALIQMLGSKPGIKVLQVVQRVAAPDIGTDIVGVYSHLCFEGHNDHTALERRHLRGATIVFGNETLSVAAAIQILAIGCLMTYSAMAGINAVAQRPHPKLVEWSNEMAEIAGKLFGKYAALTQANLRAAGFFPANV